MQVLSNIKEFFTHSDKKLRDDRWIFISMLIGAILSLTASFVLSVETYELAKNPDANLSCNFNVVLNCASVAKHPSSETFGFPNPLLGLMAESVVITVAIAGLAGIRFPRGFMFAAQIGYTFGFIFALYLFSVSFFVIQALCPWCLLVTVTTIMVFFAMTRFNIRENNLYLPKSVMKPLHKWVEKDYDKLTMAVLIVGLFAAIILKYGEALFT